MEDGEDEQIISGALIIEDDRDNSYVEDHKDMMSQSIGYMEDDFYDNEMAAKATVMKMRNSNALIFFPGDDFVQVHYSNGNEHEEELKNDKIRSKTEKNG
jgi:FtsP/CotA-like multicopper oxidase with cupredoxin domain